MPALWIQGEISNFAAPGSGHWYFSLKDAAAQVRCAMFRQRRCSRSSARNGLLVLARRASACTSRAATTSCWSITSRKRAKGALRRQFELLKARLQAEGLFAAERKRPLPTLPQRIGIITSPTGAAIRDILHILRRRFPAVPVLIYPVPVQGAGAAREIAAAVRLASTRAECDVLILARGGGSLEDLRAFNDEAVARALASAAFRSSPASATKWTSPSPISWPTCAHRRPRVPPSSWLPISGNGRHGSMPCCVGWPAR